MTSPVLLIVLWETATFRASFTTSQHFREGWSCLSWGSLELCKIKVLTMKKKRNDCSVWEKFIPTERQELLKEKKLKFVVISGMQSKWKQEKLCVPTCNVIFLHRVWLETMCIPRIGWRASDRDYRMADRSLGEKDREWTGMQTKPFRSYTSVWLLHRPSQILPEFECLLTIFILNFICE